MSKNVKTSSPTLDLHGAKREEVLAKLDRFLTQANEKGHAQVRVMTGKGTGTIQAEVVKLLKQAHYPWKFERLANGTENTGVLVVFVK